MSYYTDIAEQGFSEFDAPPFVDESGHGDECLCRECKEAHSEQYHVWLEESARRMADVEAMLAKRERAA